MPGGVVVPLDAKAEAEVARRFPGVSIERLNRIVSEYRIYRDHHEKAPTTKEVRAELERIVEQVGALRLSLAQLSEEAEDLMWPSAYQAGDSQIGARTANDLALLMHVAKTAFNDTPEPEKGKRPRPEGPLIRNLAAMLRDSGLDADSAPKGPLCTLVKIILNDNRSDTRKLVQRALANSGT